MSDRGDEAPASRRGVMLVVSSPSGAGKTTLTRQLVDEREDVELSISVTTRERRPNERDGHHYHFVTVEEFNRLRDTGELLEWAEVFGNFYATPRAAVMATLEAGCDVVFDIDWQGGRQLRDRARDDVASVFILPPSARELMSRLVRRDEDTLDEIQRRLAGAIHELEHWNEYDFVIVNDDLKTAFGELSSILTAARNLVRRRPGASGLVEELRIALQTEFTRSSSR